MVIGLQTFLYVALINFIQFVFGHLDQDIIVNRLIIITYFHPLANRLFLIMEHCCNGELFSYITSKNKLKEEESCRLF